MDLHLPWKPSAPNEYPVIYDARGQAVLTASPRAVPGNAHAVAEFTAAVANLCPRAVDRLAAVALAYLHALGRERGEGPRLAEMAALGFRPETSVLIVCEREELDLVLALVDRFRRLTNTLGLDRRPRAAHGPDAEPQ